VSEPLDLQSARRFFADTLSKVLPRSARITIRADPELGEAGVFHCHWPLDEKEKGPYSEKHSREITVQISSAALNAFRAATPKERGRIRERFESVFKVRMAEGGYNPIDPPHPPFKVLLDEHAWEEQAST
jgi:hypothetical protein